MQYRSPVRCNNGNDALRNAALLGLLCVGVPVGLSRGDIPIATTGDVESNPNIVYDSANGLVHVSHVVQTAGGDTQLVRRSGTSLDSLGAPELVFTLPAGFTTRATDMGVLNDGDVFHTYSYDNFPISRGLATQEDLLSTGPLFLNLSWGVPIGPDDPPLDTEVLISATATNTDRGFAVIQSINPDGTVRLTAEAWDDTGNELFSTPLASSVIANINTTASAVDVSNVVQKNGRNIIYYTYSTPTFAQRNATIFAGAVDVDTGEVVIPNTPMGFTGVDPHILALDDSVMLSQSSQGFTSESSILRPFSEDLATAEPTRFVSPTNIPQFAHMDFLRRGFDLPSGEPTVITGFSNVDIPGVSGGSHVVIRKRAANGRGLGLPSVFSAADAGFGIRINADADIDPAHELIVATWLEGNNSDIKGQQASVAPIEDGSGPGAIHLAQWTMPSTQTPLDFAGGEIDTTDPTFTAEFAPGPEDPTDSALQISYLTGGTVGFKIDNLTQAELDSLGTDAVNVNIQLSIAVDQAFLDHEGLLTISFGDDMDNDGQLTPETDDEVLIYRNGSSSLLVEGVDFVIDEAAGFHIFRFSETSDRFITAAGPSLEWELFLMAEANGQFDPVIWIDDVSIWIEPVPEPAALSLWLGAMGLLAKRRRAVRCL